MPSVDGVSSAAVSDPNRCTSCGAQVAPDLEVCNYCHAPTPWAARLRWEREQRHAVQQHYQQQAEHTQEQQRRYTLERQMNAAASASLGWSVASLVCCILPVPGVVGLIKALTARKIARELRLATPNGALAGITLSGLSVLLGAAMWIFIVVDELGRSQRIAELEKELAEAREEKSLDAEEACRLVELHVLKEKPTGLSGRYEIDCDGATLRKEGGKSYVDGVKYLKSPPAKLSACLRKGDKWVVDEVRIDLLCGKEYPAVQASASGATSAAASASAATSAASSASSSP